MGFKFGGPSFKFGSSSFKFQVSSLGKSRANHGQIAGKSRANDFSPSRRRCLSVHAPRSPLAEREPEPGVCAYEAQLIYQQ